MARRSKCVRQPMHQNSAHRAFRSQDSVLRPPPRGGPRKTGSQAYHVTNKFELTKITRSRQALPSLTSKPIYGTGENSQRRIGSSSLSYSTARRANRTPPLFSLNLPRTCARVHQLEL
jgi:hypothetical protein